jgi:hypothetical protein
MHLCCSSRPTPSRIRGKVQRLVSSSFKYTKQIVVPSSDASPSFSHRLWRLDTPPVSRARRAPIIPKLVNLLPWLALAREISTSVRQRDSRLECGDGDTPICARALAWHRAVGRIASSVPRADDEHWLCWAQIGRRSFAACYFAVNAKKTDDANAVRRSPAQHLPRLLLYNATTCSCN